MLHKQDRHNCNILVTLKLYIGDLANWRINITGSHIPPEDNVEWRPPRREQLRIDEDMRDVVIMETQKESATNVEQVYQRLLQDSTMDSRTPSKRKMSYFLASVKKTKGV